MSKSFSSEFNNYSLLVFLGAVWAASFVAIKFSNEIFNPIEVGFYRTFIGSLFLFCAVKLRKGSINSKTIVFNNLINDVGGYKSQWEVSLEDSWHSRFIK